MKICFESIVYYTKIAIRQKDPEVMSTHIWRFLPQAVKVGAYVYKYAKNN